MPEPYIVPANGVIAYQNFTAPTNFTEDKWVQAIEVRPGARIVVHHILVFVSGKRPNEAYTQIVPQRRRRSQTGTNEQSSKMADTLFATTAPGTNATLAGRTDATCWIASASGTGDAAATAAARTLAVAGAGDVAVHPEAAATGAPAVQRC